MLYKTTAFISLGLLTTFTLLSPAQAQDAQTTAPAELTPPTGNTKFLTAHAFGTQNYICLPAAGGQSNSWLLYAPRATLGIIFTPGFQQRVVSHFLNPVPNMPATALPGCTVSAATNQVDCPTWQSLLDGSMVWGEKAASINAGTDPSCPSNGAIACLLIKAVATRPGMYGSGLLGKTTYIQRLNTRGGSPPTGSCKLGDQALIGYSADYSFFSTASRVQGQ